MAKDLLFEIGAEEIPAGFIRSGTLCQPDVEGKEDTLLQLRQPEG